MSVTRNSSVTVTYNIHVPLSPISDSRLAAMVAFGKGLAKKVTDEEVRLMADELLRSRATSDEVDAAPEGP